MGKFRRAFGKLRDPRAANAQHDLLEILVIALAATLCGAQSAAEMALFGRSKEALLRGFLRLEHGIPSHDTFSRVFRLLNPAAFEHHFRRFMAAFAKANRQQLSGVVAVDGKALRRAYERGRGATPMQLVNVFAAETKMVLAARQAPGRNEALGALEVLGMLCLKGCTVTADALHCHRAFAAKVLDRGADYVLALKRNQSKLHAAVASRFARKGARRSAKQLEPATHDRREWRRATVIRDSSLAAAQNFPGVVALGRITCRRRQLGGGRAAPPVVRYFLLSRYLSPRQLLRTVRSHWAIENQLHWMLDVNFNEDACRARKDNAPENLAILLRLAINIIRAHPEPVSMRQKIKRAAWDETFLLGLFSHMR
jgi:predicted transposase YbfD/YdcC